MAPTFQLAYDKTFLEARRKVEQSLNSWKHLNLEEDQKVTTLHWHCLSHFLYFSRTFATSVQADALLIIDKLMKEYFWVGGNPWVNWQVLTLPKHKTGLAIPSIQRYTWVAQLSVWADLKTIHTQSLWKTMIFIKMQGSIQQDWLDALGSEVNSRKPGLLYIVLAMHDCILGMLGW